MEKTLSATLAEALSWPPDARQEKGKNLALELLPQWLIEQWRNVQVRRAVTINPQEKRATLVVEIRHDRGTTQLRFSYVEKEPPQLEVVVYGKTPCTPLFPQTTDELVALVKAQVTTLSTKLLAEVA
jgi:hypothetical protein